jgi:hypothetical protein
VRRQQVWFRIHNDVLGRSTGMKSRLPSFSVGMNSLPMPLATFAALSHPRASSFLTMGRGRPKASTIAVISSAAVHPRMVRRCDKAQLRAGS